MTSENLVTRKEAVTYLAEHDYDGTTYPCRFARTVVVLHDKVDEALDWYRAEYDEKLRYLNENTALRSCVDRLWGEGCGIHGPEPDGWFWVKNGLREPMTEAEIAVMEKV